MAIVTVENGYLGKREFHGALAKHSPFRIAPVQCTGCGTMFDNACEILDELCHGCWKKGVRQIKKVEVVAKL